MRKFFIGLLTGLIIGSGVLAAAAPGAMTALQTGLQLIIYGKTVPADKAVLTINGNYYVPIKPVCEALGLKSNVNLKRRALELGEATTILPPGRYTMANPAPLNITQSFSYKDVNTQFKAEIQVKEVIRGEDAWKMIQPVNPFNSPPRNGYEYLLAKIYFKLTDIPDGKNYELTPAAFNLISEKGKEYVDKPFVVPPDPELRTNLYKGADQEGWVIYELRADDRKPRIVFGRMRDGAGGIWFKAYTE